MIHWRLLRAIVADPGHGPTVYQTRLGVTVGVVQRACDRLEELRYITRRPVPDQGNRVALRPTLAGIAALKEAGG